MFFVGLTGGIASGKSTVSLMMQEMGIKVIDADLIARQVVEPGKTAWKLIKAKFGDDVIQENGQIDRNKLGSIIFADEGKRKLLNSITHPYIYREMLKQSFFLFLRGTQFAVLDLPLLFESGAMVKLMNKVIVVSCDENEQINRLMARNGLSHDEAQTRINAQMPLKKKCQLAQFIVDNNGSQENTRRQVQQIVAQLTASRAQWKFRILFYGSVTLLCSSAAFVIYKISQKMNS